MSDEQSKPETDESEVEAHKQWSVTDEPAEETEDEVEAHIKRPAARYDSPKTN